MTVDDALDLPRQDGRYWLRACAADQVREDEGLRLGTVPPVSVFAAEGDFFCLDDTCSHEEYSLAEGWVEDCTVECTLHSARFSLRTGAVLGPPATAPVNVHPLAYVGSDLFVALPDTYLARKG